jgi:hypothetical protein
VVPKSLYFDRAIRNSRSSSSTSPASATVSAISDDDYCGNPAKNGDRRFRKAGRFGFCPARSIRDLLDPRLHHARLLVARLGTSFQRAKHHLVESHIDKYLSRWRHDAAFRHSPVSI